MYPETGMASMPAANTSHRQHLISGHKGRDRWLGAVIAASGLSPIAVRLAVKLGIFFNCKTGQCNPGYARLAREIGISRRSVIRAIAALEADGWIAIVRSDGHHDHKSEFTLLMPGERVTPDVTPTGDKDMAPVQAAGRVTKNIGTGDKSRGERVTHAVTTKEPDEPEEPEGRGCAARSADDDRDSINNSTAVDAPPNPALSTVDAATNSEPVDSPVPRAEARTEPIAAQNPKPSRNETEISTPTTAANGARAAFPDVSYAWPSDRTDDDGIAYAAYVAALAAAQGDTDIVFDAVEKLLWESGADPPWLSDALRRIEHDLRYGNPEEDEDD
jgi:hypothetical protein